MPSSELPHLPRASCAIGTMFGCGLAWFITIIRTSSPPYNLKRNTYVIGYAKPFVLHLFGQYILYSDVDGQASQDLNVSTQLVTLLNKLHHLINQPSMVK